MFGATSSLILAVVVILLLLIGLIGFLLIKQARKPRVSATLRKVGQSAKLTSQDTVVVVKLKARNGTALKFEVIFNGAVSREHKGNFAFGFARKVPLSVKNLVLVIINHKDAPINITLG